MLIGDKGFTCDDVVSRFGARLTTPEFMPKGGKFSKKQIRRTQIIAQARAPIERFNERLKNYEFVGDGKVDHSKLCILKEAVYVCGILANFSRCLVEH